MAIFLILAGAVLVFGLVSRRLESSVVTAPMVFAGLGLLLGPGLGLVKIGEHREIIHLLAEITIVIVLFTDASRIDLKLLRRDHDLPLRMLLIGLPLSILLGMGIAWAMLPGITLFGAAVLAAVLAPTDAALGQAVVSNPKVPARIRQALNVEGGLNDGIALPAVLIFISLAAAGDSGKGAGYWATFIGTQLLMGPVVGIAVGGIGGLLISRAARYDWMNHVFQQMSGIALALLSFGLAEICGGNGLIAAFTAGLTIGNLARPVCSCLYEFAEAEGQLLVLGTFFIFGAIMVGPYIELINWLIVAYAVLSLTLIRMTAVWVSLSGSGMHRHTVFFLGWFGPRGIATILFALLLFVFDTL